MWLCMGTNYRASLEPRSEVYCLRLNLIDRNWSIDHNMDVQYQRRTLQAKAILGNSTAIVRTCNSAAIGRTCPDFLTCKGKKFPYKWPLKQQKKKIKYKYNSNNDKTGNNNNNNNNHNHNNNNRRKIKLI